MHVQSRFAVAATLALITLSGCGGGGGSEIASTPPPPAPPVPPPPPVAYAGPIALQSPQPFATAGYATRYSIDVVGTNPQLLTGPSEGDVIAFRQLPGTNQYELSLPGYQTGELRPIHYNGSICSNGIVCNPTSTGSRIAVGSSDVLQDAMVTIPVPGTTYPDPLLTYTSLVHWTGSSPDPAQPGREIRSEGVFAYGIPTAQGDVPTTGSATYQALVEGRTTDIGTPVGGDATLTFNFAQGTLSGEMRPTIPDGWDMVPVGTYTFTQTVFGVGSTTFSGLFDGPLPGGGFAGQFTGPQAAELLARWRAPFLHPSGQGTGTMFGVLGRPAAMIRGIGAAVLLVALTGVCRAEARQDGVVKARPVTRQLLGANQMFGLAEAAERRGDAALTDAIYRALSADPVLAIRSEARFRRAMRAVQGRRYAQSAVLLRQILDEQPGAQRVRLELARVLELLDDEEGARRHLRAARAGGLPPDVARFVDRYSAALRARKPLGGSIELAVAPDTNINRATRDDTLGTILGDFELDKDAKQQSGTGLAARGQAYGRIKVSDRASLLARVSGAADIYRKSDFNTVTLAVSAGPELMMGRDRLAIEAGVTRRTFGGKRLAAGVSIAGSYLRPLGSVSQLRVTGSVARISHHQNRLQSGRVTSVSIGYERALSASAGIGASLALDRQKLRDAGYSSRAGK